MNRLLQTVLICGFVFLAFSCGDETDRRVADSEVAADDLSEIPRLNMQPGNGFLLTPVGHLTEDYETPDHIDKEALRSFIFVQPGDSLNAVRQFDRGHIVEFSLDEDLTISARINRNQAMGQRIRNLTASILEPYGGVVTLSIDQDRMTGNIDLVSENRLFHLRYDSLSGLHYLAEIDRSRLDVQEGADPLEID